jgi:hypothetical protein
VTSFLKHRLKPYLDYGSVKDKIISIPLNQSSHQDLIGSGGMAPFIPNIVTR